MTEELTVEVFYDVLYPSSNLRPILEGIETVKAVANNLRLSRYGRPIELNGEPRGFLVTDDLVFPEFDADINIVATGKQIWDAKYVKVLGFEVCSRYSPINGIAIHQPYSDDTVSRVALINIEEFRNSRLTTAHELGHFLINLTKEHCASSKCVMYPHEVRRESPLNFSTARLAMKASYYRKKSTVVNHSFCSSCTADLRKGEFALQFSDLVE